MTKSFWRWRQRARQACLAAGVVVSAGLAVQGETLSLKPQADTSLFERFQNNNLGRSWLAAGTLNSRHKARALVQFDLSAIPANAVIQSASLSLRVVKAPSGAASSTFEVRRVLVPWDEGARGTLGVNTGAAAQAGETTWLSRGAASWSAPGGANGTDYAGATSATASLSGATLAFASGSGLIADVQSWVEQPDQNFGWVVISQSEATPKTARRFGSRETVNSEPVLAIEYIVSALPQPPTLVSPTRVGDRFQFRFTAEANQTYTVESAGDPAGSAWLMLTNFPASASPREIVVEDTGNEPGRYYRVRSP